MAPSRCALLVIAIAIGTALSYVANGLPIGSTGQADDAAVWSVESDGRSADAAGQSADVAAYLPIVGGPDPAGAPGRTRTQTPSPEPSATPTRAPGPTPTPEPGPTCHGLNDVQMLTAQDGWAVGAGGTILHWDGRGWVLAGSPTRAELYSISMVNGSDGWIVGLGTTLRWDGAEWTRTPYPFWASSIEMLSSDLGWAAGLGELGESRMVLRWDGTSWILEAASVPATALSALLPPTIAGPLAITAPCSIGTAERGPRPATPSTTI